ncbi:MAG: arylsulfatase, partial [Armatimonadota bacterium]|nr:arylsulfatase [Armatimonadota bacterium]
MSNRRDFLKGVGRGAAALFLGGAARGETAARRLPNILFILADDVGYGDLGCYGATRVRTPHLDRLAADGLRFVDAHAPSAMCSPTRYAVMTGEYAWRGPLKSGVLSGVSPLCIEPGRLTLPEVLRRAGYVTGCVGKWHLGLGSGDLDYNGEIRPGPLDVGFNTFFGIAATGDRVPCVYLENRRVMGLDPNDPIRVSYGPPVGDEPTGRHHPELLTMKLSHGHDNTIINGISRIGYMSGGKAARWKDEEMADTLTRKAVEFITRNRERPFFLYFATHDIHVPRVPHPRFRGTSSCGVRGDVIHQLDWCVGELLQALERQNLSRDTLVLFSSDNGGVLDDGYADGAVEDLNGHQPNGLLRGYKGGLYEGGTRVPLIARWPGQVRPGVCTEMVCLVDLLATCAALTGQPLPSSAGPDSFDFSPLLLGRAAGGVRPHLVLHAGSGALAVRQGPWKLIP